MCNTSLCAASSETMSALSTSQLLDSCMCLCIRKPLYGEQSFADQARHVLISRHAGCVCSINNVMHCRTMHMQDTWGNFALLEQQSCMPYHATNHSDTTGGHAIQMHADLCTAATIIDPQNKPRHYSTTHTLTTF